METTLETTKAEGRWSRAVIEWLRLRIIADLSDHPDSLAREIGDRLRVETASVAANLRVLTVDGLVDQAVAPGRWRLREGRKARRELEMARATGAGR